MIPPAPSILLIPREKCLDDNFWYEINEEYRDVLAGVGVDKECLVNPGSRELMERAAKLGLAVHAWTQRPELEYLARVAAPPLEFESGFDEIFHLFCSVGIHGKNGIVMNVASFCIHN